MTTLALALSLTRMGHPSATQADLARARILAVTIASAARAHGEDPILLAALCAHESPGFVRRVGKLGERGLCQILPATARFLGFRGSDQALAQDPINFGYAAEWLAHVRKTCGRHGYTADEAALDKYRGSRCQARNQRKSRYARQILHLAGMARALAEGPAPAGVAAYFEQHDGPAAAAVATTKPHGARRAGRY